MKKWPRTKLGDHKGRLKIVALPAKITKKQSQFSSASGVPEKVAPTNSRRGATGFGLVAFDASGFSCGVVEHVSLASVHFERLKNDDHDQAIDQIAASFMSCAQIDPILIRSRGPFEQICEDWVVVAGRKRCVAALRLGQKTIRAVSRDGMTDEECRELSLSSNLDRGKLIALDFAEQIVELANLRLAKAPHVAEPAGGIQPNDLGQTARAKATGISPDTMARYLRIAALSEEVKAEARRNGNAKSHRALLELCKRQNATSCAAIVARPSECDDVTRSAESMTGEARRGHASELGATESPVENEHDASYARDAGPIPDSLNVKDPEKAYLDLVKLWRRARFKVAFEDAPVDARRRFVEEVLLPS